MFIRTKPTWKVTTPPTPFSWSFPCGAAPQRGQLPPHSWDFYITHNDALQSVGFRWTCYQLVAETSTWQHTTITRDRHPCPRRGSTHNLSSWAAADLRLRLHDHWDRLLVDLITVRPSAEIRYKFKFTITRTQCSPYSIFFLLLRVA
jgi:hypothetical protein